MTGKPCRRFCSSTQTTSFQIRLGNWSNCRLTASCRRSLSLPSLQRLNGKGRKTEWIRVLTNSDRTRTLAYASALITGLTLIVCSWMQPFGVLLLAVALVPWLLGLDASPRESKAPTLLLTLIFIQGAFGCFGHAISGYTGWPRVMGD